MPDFESRFGGYKPLSVIRTTINILNTLLYLLLCESAGFAA